MLDIIFFNLTISSSAFTVLRRTYLLRFVFAPNVLHQAPRNEFCVFVLEFKPSSVPFALDYARLLFLRSQLQLILLIHPQVEVNQLDQTTHAIQPGCPNTY